jgi:hypothetical protein
LPKPVTCVRIRTLVTAFASISQVALFFACFFSSWPFVKWPLLRLAFLSKAFYFGGLSFQTAFYSVGCMPRVDRVPGFFTSRPNWDPPPPHPQASVFPRPFGSGRRNTLACGRGSRGVPIRTSGQALHVVPYSVYFAAACQL